MWGCGVFFLKQHFYTRQCSHCYASIEVLLLTHPICQSGTDSIGHNAPLQSLISELCKASYPGPDSASISVQSCRVGDVHSVLGDYQAPLTSYQAPAPSDWSTKCSGALQCKREAFSECTKHTRVSHVAEVSSKGMEGGGGGSGWGAMRGRQ